MKSTYTYIILSLCILTATFSTSCSSSKETPVIDTPTSVISPSNILAKSREAMSSAKSYQFELSHRIGKGSQIDQSLTLVSATGSVSRGKGISLESQLLFGNIPVSAGVIKTKNSLYLRDPLSQKWQLIPEDANPFKFLDPDTILASIIDNLYELNLLVSKGKVFKISGHISPHSLGDIFQDTVNEEANVTIWFNRESFVITRVELEGKISAVDPGDILRLIEITTSDKVLEIVAPEIK